MAARRAATAASTLGGQRPQWAELTLLKDETAFSNSTDASTDRPATLG